MATIKQAYVTAVPRLGGDDGGQGPKSLPARMRRQWLRGLLLASTGRARCLTW
jgi:hypothetical protein